jgi:hypothetical protein
MIYRQKHPESISYNNQKSKAAVHIDILRKLDTRRIIKNILDNQIAQLAIPLQKY